jgi:hypothetical protein
MVLSMQRSPRLSLPRLQAQQSRFQSWLCSYLYLNYSNYLLPLTSSVSQSLESHFSSIKTVAHTSLLPLSPPTIFSETPSSATPRVSEFLAMMSVLGLPSAAKMLALCFFGVSRYSDRTSDLALASRFHLTIRCSSIIRLARPTR